MTRLCNLLHLCDGNHCHFTMICTTFQPNTPVIESLFMCLTTFNYISKYLILSWTIAVLLYSRNPTSLIFSGGGVVLGWSSLLRGMFRLHHLATDNTYCKTIIIFMILMGCAADSIQIHIFTPFVMWEDCFK